MKFDLELLEFVECEINSGKLAVAGSDRDLTWKQFQDEVETLKEKLLSYNLPKGHPVIIYGHKEANFLVSSVACMSLKLPYIPVDTVYPRDRLNKIQKITQSGLLIDLTQNKINYDVASSTTSFDMDDQIIYIIFTSGSTGEPKGVQITKSAILDFKQWLSTDFNFSDINVFMNQAPFSFDLSVYELMGFLLFGSTIILNDKSLLENHIEYFSRLKQYNCNTWVSTPSFISKYLLSDEFNSNNIRTLKTFLFCGEVLPSNTAKRILLNFKDATVLNSYGPTEATVATTLIEITKEIIDKYPKSLPVGYVKPRTTINLLQMDEDGVGEIEIIGDNVSIGYFKNDILNKKKFSIMDDKRSFKTGDYGYFKNNMLFFAERKDELIKLHGFRIELGEIDKEILHLDGIHESVTITLKRGAEVIRLVTFVISDSPIDQNHIKESIGEKLPYYMIPSDIVQLEKFPYNINHKIDKKELINIYHNL